MLFKGQLRIFLLLAAFKPLFSEHNSGGSRCGFLWVFPAWAYLKSKICGLRFFFSPSNLMILLQTFFCPVPLLLEFQLNIRSLDMTSHMALKLCSYFFFTPYFSLNGYYWSTLKFADTSSIEPKLLVESSGEFFISDTVFFGSRISIWLFLKFPFLHSNSYLLSHYVSMSVYLSFFLFVLGHIAYMSCDFLLYAGYCR